jgi:hypothetical protein
MEREGLTEKTYDVKNSMSLFEEVIALLFAVRQVHLRDV